jgi:hypothetical protein
MTATYEDRRAATVTVMSALADTDYHYELKIDRALSIISLLMYELTEFELRELLVDAGIDLSNGDELEVVKLFTTWFVGAGALVLYDTLGSVSLVDTELDCYRDHDDEMKERTNKLITDGMEAREFLV